MKYIIKTYKQISAHETQSEVKPILKQIILRLLVKSLLGVNQI